MNAFANPAAVIGPVADSGESVRPAELGDRDRRWETQFAVLREFFCTHGHVCVKGRTETERELGAWMEEQRERARAGDITRAEHERLSALGFDWEPRDEEWQRWLDELRAFRREHGHCTVPERERELAAWVESVRQEYHLGRLSAARVRVLEELGFSWELVRETSDARWAMRLAELEDFKREHGHCRVPNHSKQWGSLAAWVSALRQMRRRGNLPSARLATLDALEFDWEPGHAAGDGRWQARYVQLVAFQRAHGHCCVPAKWAEDRAFGNWVHNQRAFKKAGTLSPERARRLEAVGFAWEGSDGRSDPHEVYFEKMLAKLEAFRAEHGHTEVPATWRDRTLAKWVLRQRKALRAGEMSAERQSRLDAAGFVWRATRRHDAERWEENFAKLEAYRERFGHCQVPARWEEDRCWSYWVHNLRQFRTKGSLTAERVARLDAIGFEWKASHYMAPSLEGHWDRMYAELTAFRARHGHTEVPPSYSQRAGLAKWVQRQRTAMHRGELRADRQARLEALGFALHGTRRGDAERWERRYRQLLDFRTRFGHCRVTKSFQEDLAFGYWVHNQRSFKRQGKLSAEKIARLEACGVEW